MTAAGRHLEIVTTPAALPRTPSLRDLGADIVRFAEVYPGFPTDRRGLAIDMVRYENAFVDVFDGPEYAPLNPATST